MDQSPPPPRNLFERTTLPPDAVPTSATPAGAHGAAPTAVGADPAHGLGPDQRIGSYVVRRLIGIGGMGAVFEAEQDNPRRIVALKVLRTGLSSQAAQRRFEHEAHLLARLRHPNIAQVYEAGTHRPPAPIVAGHTLPAPDAIPFYAMEYIPGAMSITQFAQAKSLSLRDRLALFAKVCDAIHHGHSKGVIHRDIKPANILVDSNAEPKVIDFGVALAIEADPHARGVHTLPGSLIGTPQYMSPEQVGLDASDIDTRSDVYALGVVLYELLTGELPYDLTRTSIHELTRIIRQEPPKRFDPATTTLFGRGGRDVETIAFKALEKDRARRYQSAADLAADIHRYLNNEPIAARPATVSYQLRVMARRNRGLAAAMLVALLAVVAGVAVTTMFGIREARQRRVAVAALDQARLERDRSQRTTDFLRELLATADPSVSQNKDLTVRELVDVAAGRIGEVFKDDPLTAAQLRLTLGQTYIRLGTPIAAEGMFRSAHDAIAKERGEDDPDALNALSLTGTAVTLAGKPAEGEAILSDALRRQTAAEGEDHADTLSTMSNLALALQDQEKLDEAEKMLRRSLEAKTRTLGPTHRETLSSLMVLSDLLQTMGRVDEAIRVGQDAVKRCESALGPSHPSTLTAQSILGSALYDTGRYQEALPILQRTYEARVRVLGENHTDTLLTLNTLAMCQEGLGNLAEAEPALRKCLVGARATLGPEHSTTLSYANNLANFLSRRGGQGGPTKQADLDEAERLLRESLALRERVSGPDHSATLSVVNNLALVLEYRGRFDLAKPLYQRVVAGFERTLEPDHWLRFAATKNLADCMVDLGETKEAEVMLKNTYEGFKGVLGEDNGRTRSAAASLKRLYEKANMPDEAAKWAALAASKQ